MTRARIVKNLKKGPDRPTVHGAGLETVMDAEERMNRDINRACTEAMLAGVDPADVALALLHMAGEIVTLPVGDDDAA